VKRIQAATFALLLPVLVLAPLTLYRDKGECPEDAFKPTEKEMQK
jgi:hypothetical protein